MSEVRAMTNDEFILNGETYYWGRPSGPSDFGMVPSPPQGLREAWAEGPAPQWEITIGDDEREGRS